MFIITTIFIFIFLRQTATQAEPSQILRPRASQFHAFIPFPNDQKKKRKKERRGTNKETSRNFHLCRCLLFQFSFSFQRKNFPVQLLTHSKGKITPYEGIRINNLLKEGHHHQQ